MACPKCGGSQTTIGYEEAEKQNCVWGVNRCIDPTCDVIDKSLLVKDMDEKYIHPKGTW